MHSQDKWWGDKIHSPVLCRHVLWSLSDANMRLQQSGLSKSSIYSVFGVKFCLCVALDCVFLQCGDGKIENFVREIQTLQDIPLICPNQTADAICWLLSDNTDSIICPHSWVLLPSLTGICSIYVLNDPFKAARLKPDVFPFFSNQRWATDHQTSAKSSTKQGVCCESCCKCCLCGHTTVFPSCFTPLSWKEGTAVLQHSTTAHFQTMYYGIYGIECDHIPEN